MDEDTTGKEAKAPDTRESKRETTQDFAKLMRKAHGSKELDDTRH